MAECHQHVQESTVMSGHTRHHRLRPYRTSPSPAIQDVSVCSLTRHHCLRLYKTSPSPAETCMCNNVLSLLSGGSGGVAGPGDACRSGGANVPFHLDCFCGFFAVPFWQGMQQSVWFSRTTAGCHSIAAITLLCLGNTTPHFFCSGTLAHGFWISCSGSSIAARKHPPLAILAIFKARHMSDSSSYTRPPCLALVADMLKTYRKLVAASKVWFSYYLNHIRLRSLLNHL